VKRARRAGLARDTIAALVLVVVVVPLAGCFLFVREPSRCRSDRAAVIASQDDLGAFAGCKRILGLAIRTGATIDLGPLRELEDITGDLAVGPTVGIETVSFPSLLRVGGAVRVTANGSLRALFLPVLEHAARVDVDGNIVLGTISLPRLADVTESFVVTDNRVLALVDVPSLVTIGNELVIDGQPKLELVDAPLLKRAGAVRVDHDPKLPAAAVDKLRAVAASP
jgi:hypothetical protein